MKKIFIILAAAILTAYLTLIFFLTPSHMLSKINDAQQAVVVSAEKSGGNFLTGYHFTNVFILGAEGKRLLVSEDLTLDLHLLSLFWGKIGMVLHSKEITAAFFAGFDGSLKGEANVNGLHFDTAAFIPPAIASFTAPISGRVILSGRKAEIEVRADEINWKKLSVSGFDLPADIFKKGKGALTIEPGRIVVKSLAFEGGKGYARLSGEIISGQRHLTLEIFPNNWDDFMLIPLERYKVSPGQYKMQLAL